MRVITFVVGLLLAQAAWAANPAGMTTPQNEVCTSFVTASGLVATTVQLVPLVTGQRVYVCDIEVSTGAAASTVQLEYGTGALCAVGTTVFGTLWNMAINSTKAAGNALWRGEVTPVSNALCVVPTGTGPTSVTVFYDQY